MGNVGDIRKEMTKTKEQLEEEKKISLSIRIRPLELDGLLIIATFPKKFFNIYLQVWIKKTSKLKPKSFGTRL